MSLTKYTCRIDGFTSEGPLGFPDDFWSHLEQVHDIIPLVADSRKALQHWLARHVSEEVLIKS